VPVFLCTSSLSVRGGCFALSVCAGSGHPVIRVLDRSVLSWVHSV
jgi:hypothetical protein